MAAAPPLRLSVLDQSPIAEGSTGARALADTLDLARLADGLGYHRYWVAEHHGTPMLACAAPEVLIGPIASATQRMRIGSGGVMLPHYSPLKVAESFSILAGLYGDRIDLGLGRAPGTDQIATVALQRDRSRGMPDDFPQQLAELLGYLEDRLPADHAFHRLAALPGLPGRPEPWLLGSSPQSAIWAGELGLPYAFADFINPDGAQIAALYRERFVDSQRLPAPRVAVAVWAICAESDGEAQRLASSSRMAMSMLRQGRLIPVPPVERALAYLESRERPSRAGGGERRAVLGDPDTVRAGIERVAADYGAEEVQVVSITFDHGARRRSYELIAEAFGLRDSEAGAAEVCATDAGATDAGATEAGATEAGAIEAGAPEGVSA
jgi:luciferase family oxidoreductase group 1